MRALLGLTLLVITVPAYSQWIRQKVDTTASFRGLAVVDEKVVWASGNLGTVVRTIDGGRTWKVMKLPDSEKLDFRDIEAFDANSAYALSIGNGTDSRIYKTTDGGTTWKLQFQNNDPKKFFDAIACWDSSHCIAMSDPVDGRFPLIATTNGGASWDLLSPRVPPEAKKDEAAFAASGTCLITQGPNTVFLVTGGGDARVFRSRDRGLTWTASETPIVRGASGQGIFSIVMVDAKNGFIVGGDYTKPENRMLTFAKTIDGGDTWGQAPDANGYRSGITAVDKKTLIAVGTSGADISRNGRNTWTSLGKENLNSVASKGRTATWAVGPKGMVVKLK